MKNNFILITLYMVMCLAHFFIFNFTVGCCQVIFFKYYLFLSLIFLLVITVMTISKIRFPEYLGFTFVGLVLVKLSLMFIVMNKLDLKEIPYYKFHFIIPYLISLFLLTVYAVNMISKGEKNH